MKKFSEVNESTHNFGHGDPFDTIIKIEGFLFTIISDHLNLDTNTTYEYDIKGYTIVETKNVESDDNDYENVEYDNEYEVSNGETKLFTILLNLNEGVLKLGEVFDKKSYDDLVIDNYLILNKQKTKSDIKKIISR